MIYYKYQWLVDISHVDACVQCSLENNLKLDFRHRPLDLLIIRNCVFLLFGSKLIRNCCADVEGIKIHSHAKETKKGKLIENKEISVSGQPQRNGNKSHYCHNSQTI